jgi:hypothetical protein
MLLRRILAVSCTSIFAAGLALAQTPAPMTTTPAASSAPRRPLSPPGTASTMVGGTWSAPDKEGERTYTGGKWIEITYSRPMLRGRSNVFGSGAEYGKQVSGGAPVWRTGANQTTTLKTEVPLEIGGKRLEPGSYSLFVELKENAWSLVVSKQSRQEKYDPNNKTATWGAYNYDPKFDVVRVPMTMIKPKVSIDQFTIGFVDMTDTGGKIAMGWDGEGAVAPFRVVP